MVTASIHTIRDDGTSNIIRCARFKHAVSQKECYVKGLAFS